MTLDKYVGMYLMFYSLFTIHVLKANQIIGKSDLCAPTIRIHNSSIDAC